jgi:hypothetical protein
MSTSSVVRGTLTAGRWTKVLWGWGSFTVYYRAETNPPGGEYRCYCAPVPWPISSGALPARIAHTVVVYGDVWLMSPVTANFALTPVSAERDSDFFGPPPPPPS